MKLKKAYPDVFNVLLQVVVFHSLGLELSDAVLDLLGEAGFDPIYGARSMKRAIQQQIENPLAQAILSGHFVAGILSKLMWNMKCYCF
jgi:ATP-dependent Clp protease ATP-binding subunit ClpB